MTSNLTLGLAGELRNDEGGVPDYATSLLPVVYLRFAGILAIYVHRTLAQNSFFWCGTFHRSGLRLIYFMLLTLHRLQPTPLKQHVGASQTHAQTRLLCLSHGLELSSLG